MDHKQVVKRVAIIVVVVVGVLLTLHLLNTYGGGFMNAIIKIHGG
jgi:hypothetical protein